MKIFTEGEKTTVIELSKTELKDCNLTYEIINRNKEKSRRIIDIIIKEATAFSQKDNISEKKSEIDILPDGEGGCIIIVNRKNDDERNIFQIYFSDSFDNLLDLTAKHDFKASSSLYRTNEGWWLLVSTDNIRHALCSEFLKKSERKKEYIYEYGELVIKERALEILGGLRTQK